MSNLANVALEATAYTLVPLARLSVTWTMSCRSPLEGYGLGSIVNGLIG